MRTMQPDYNEDELAFAAQLPPRSSACPPLEVLKAVGLGVLPPSVERAAADHLESCALCRMLLQDLEEVAPGTMTEGGRRRVAAALPAATEAKPQLLWWVAVAALLLCVAGIAVWKTKQTAPETAQREEPAPTVIASSEIPPLPLTPLAPPSDTGLVTRGAAKTEPATEVLLPAFRAYNAGEYDKAAASFHQLQGQYPKSSIVPLYLGVSQLMAGHDAEARATLAAIGPGKQQDAARWYEAVAASRLHAPYTAALLRSICAAKDSPYSRQSCALLP